MASVLSIGGVVINRLASRVILQRMTLAMDQTESLEFTQLVEPACDGAFSAGQVVTLTDADFSFRGFIARATPQNIGAGAIAVGYLALGRRWELNNLWVTAADGTGLMVWNLPPGDPNYLPTNSGQSLGDILKQVLDTHADALAELGVTSYTEAELTALTLVPPEPVTLSGRLWDAMADLLTQWLPNHVIWADGAGLIHVLDTTTLPASTLTLDVDPITLGSTTKDHSECFSRVVLRGDADIQAAYLSLRENTLGWDQLPADVAVWTLQDFYNPRGAADGGDILSQTSDTLTVKSDDPAAHAPVNYLSDIGAYVYAFDPLATGITFSEQVRATASTAFSAGGSYTITVAPPFSNTGYTRYQVRGNRTVGSLTWRKLKIIPTWVAEHLTRRFNHSFPWSPVDGMVVQTQTPTGVVCWSSSHDPPFNEFPWPFELVLPDGENGGYLILNEPAPKAYESQTTLETPGAARAPDDVKVIVPYSLGPLTVASPAAGGYAGTSFTSDGIERTLYRDYPQWTDAADKASMQKLADELLKSVQDTVHEGSLTYHGRAGLWLTLGRSLNIARAGGVTGWEGIKAAVRSVTLEWPQSGGSIWRTILNFTTRRRAFSGDRLYIHPAYGDRAQLGGLQGEGFNPFGLTTANMRAITQARQEQFEKDYLDTSGAYEGFGSQMAMGQEKNTYKRTLPLLSEIARSEQHQRAMQRERDRQASVDAQAAAHEDARQREGKPVDAAEAREQRTAHARDFEGQAKLYNREQREEMARNRDKSPPDEMPSDVFGG